MTQHLWNDLERLEKRLLFLGSRVEDAVRCAMTSLLELRADLTVKVIEGDAAIDQEEVEIEEDCLKILALHQPVAADLRFTAACLEINNDLERIGDLAVNIAKRAAALRRAAPFPPPAGLRAMMETTLEMVRESLGAFVRGDAALARHVLEEDDVVDRANRDIIAALAAQMEREPQVVDAALRMLSVSKHVERIADHATNIAEDVVYMVDGEIIRHAE